MFAVIVSGRLAQTEYQQVSELQILFTLHNADNINYIVVFMTGSQPFPEGLGGSVYFSWPDPNAPPVWQHLGHISNEKPSAIFRITKPKAGEDSSMNPFGQTFQQISHVAQIGISIEPLNQITFQTPETNSVQTVDSFTEFTTKMLESFYNYASSFAISSSNMEQSVTDAYVPLSTLQQWYVNFQRRLIQSPNFWKG